MIHDMRLPIDSDLSRSIDEALTPPALRTPFSQSLPRRLAPLVIPTSELPAPLLQSKISSSKLRSDSTPPTASTRSGRTDNSPLSRPRITPSASTPDLSYPRSATTDNSSAVTLPTPISAPIMESHRASPRPWDGSSTFSAQSDRGVLARTQDGQRKPNVHVHRRGASESSTSMMDRGRPRKRAEVRNNNGPLLKSNETKRTMSCERRAFEELPKGWKPSEAIHKLNANDVMALQKQALGQAERFEVLKVEDVDALSKELRHLDERTDYLRRTYTSLRSGRRNLHSRICQYLRSPRVAKFSHDSMLKQEEALAELDASIDDWVTKLEQAENRRTRVRQKLLEHVAAAALLPVANQSSGMSESLQQVISPGGPRELSTPPRSPSKASFASRTGSNSPSPQRVVAQVPSTIIEQPVVEDAAPENGTGISRAGSTVTLKRSDVESIRIYAGDDVYALLADVENEISKMGSHSPAPTPEPKANAVTKEIQHQRQRSHEKLSGRADCPSPSVSIAPPLPHHGVAASASPTANAPSTTNTTPAMAPTASTSTQLAPPSGSKTMGAVASAIAAINRDASNTIPNPMTPPAKDTAKKGEILLTAAVFRP